jgi:glutamine amidotransferase
MIGIVDYNAGNLKSVERALKFLNSPYLISKNPKDLIGCEKIIFPGVGEAKYAMEQLTKSGFASFLKDYTQAGKLLLGICLGSQIIFDYSEEGDTKCLGLIPGKIMHFDSLLPQEITTDELGYKLKIPHMGWNSINYTNTFCPLFNGINENTDFYFVHSYVIQPENKDVITCYADYGIKVPAGIKSGNLYAFQFHPEKSAQAGLQILKNFSRLDEKGELEK